MKGLNVRTSIPSSRSGRIKATSVRLRIIVLIAVLYSVIILACIVQLFRLQEQDRRMQQNEIISIQISKARMSKRFIPWSSVFRRSNRHNHQTINTSSPKRKRCRRVVDIVAEFVIMNIVHIRPAGRMFS